MDEPDPPPKPVTVQFKNSGNEKVLYCSREKKSQENKTNQLIYKILVLNKNRRQWDNVFKILHEKKNLHEFQPIIQFYVLSDYQ